MGSTADGDGHSGGGVRGSGGRTPRAPRSVAAPPASSLRNRRDWGRSAARVLCVLFATLGVIPLTLGVVVRLSAVQAWASRETARVLDRELHLKASYRLHIEPWPFQIALDDVRIEATDDGGPFFQARRLVVQPRMFALLNGELDVGEVRLEEPSVRAVVKEGRLVNLDLTVPESPPDAPSAQLPLTALSISNGEFDISIDGLRIRSRQTDLDLTVDDTAPSQADAFPPNPIELALRSGAIAIDSRHADPTGGERVDEDRLCSLQVRARVSPGEILIRRLDAAGAVDLDPGLDTRPACDLAESDWRHLSMAAAALRIALDADGIKRVEGRLAVRVPVPIVHRFVNVGPTTGRLELDADDFNFVRGQRAPRVRGHLRGEQLGVMSKVIAQRLTADLDLTEERVEASNLAVEWAGGNATIERVRVSPWSEGVPLEATAVHVRGVAFQRLFEALSGSPNAHVAWQLDDVKYDHFGGTLSPLSLNGPIVAETLDFAVYDRPASRQDRQRIVGLSSAKIAGDFAVNPAGIFLNDVTITTPRSRILTSVALHFSQQLGVTLKEGTVIDLADVSPLASLEVGGRASIVATIGGQFTHPELLGNVTVDDLVIQGFPIGKLAGAIAFEPVHLELTAGTVVHGRTTVQLPELHLDFGRPPATLVLTSRIDSTGSGIYAEDFFEMLRLEHDPNYRDIRGIAKGIANARFVFGGPEDACGGGKLFVDARLDLSDILVLGQSFETGSVDLDYLWDDRPAGAQGVVVDVHALSLRKGPGSVLGRASIRHDAEVEADFTATAIPLTMVDSLGLKPTESRVLPDGTVSGVARFDGTLQRLHGLFDVSMSSIRLGPAMLPGSRIEVEMLPETKPLVFDGKSVCEHRIARELLPMSETVSERGSDEAATFQLRHGKLFGGQVAIDDLIFTRGERPMLREGTIRLDALDLGALANLVAGVAYSTGAPKGTASGEFRLEQMPLDNPALGEARLRIDKLELSRDGTTVTIGKVEQELALTADALKIPSLPITLTPKSGVAATVTVAGRIEELSTSPRLDLHATLTPIDLSRLTDRLPFISRAAGIVTGSLHVDGPYFLPSLTGELGLERGSLRFANVNLPLDDVTLRVVVRGGEVEIKQATARAGASGQLSLTGRMPLRGLELAEVNATLAARDIALPVAEGVKATANALLHVSYQPGVASTFSRNASDIAVTAGLPQVTGTVSLTNFNYARPIAFRVDLDQLTGKTRTLVDTYDPRNDFVAFDVAVVSPRPLRIVNNLIDTSLDVTPPGLRLTGTNQRFGARGSLRLEPASKLFIQGHDFRVREGRIDFDNATRVAPRLDVTADTEVRRYASAASSATAGSSDAGASAGTVWRVSMHATGDTDAPVVQLSSDPPLSQDDIVLLLQIGMTRAEIERGLTSSLAQSVSLEALSAVTGFDQALRKTVPIIDDFRLGSQYSSRTGRPEPTVSIGKRITDNLRATVTTGLSDNRELRSNIQWKLKQGLSFQGSYDNVNDISNSTTGNIGADLRWRIEFE